MCPEGSCSISWILFVRRKPTLYPEMKPAEGFVQGQAHADREPPMLSSGVQWVIKQQHLRWKWVCRQSLPKTPIWCSVLKSQATWVALPNSHVLEPLPELESPAEIRRGGLLSLRTLAILSWAGTAFQLPPILLFNYKLPLVQFHHDQFICCGLFA